jgi:hypothetical protein
VKPEDLVNALATACPRPLAETLVKEFIQIRQDVATGALGRAAPGKLIETFVQILQHLETGAHEQKPDVDEYLRKLETRATTLDDGLRICAARLARASYTLRNKRAIAHIGAVDPNAYDLRFLLHGSQWLIAELLRVASKVSMAEAGRLIEQVHEPVGGLIEDYCDRRLVLADLSTRDEVIVLLHRSYPQPVPLSDLLKSLDRRTPRAVKEWLRRLWKEKIADGDIKSGYRLTARGYDEAMRVIRETVG